MKSLVVYETYFGNTEKVAQAIGKGLGTQKSVTVKKVDEAGQDLLQGIDLLVVGSPTRGFRPVQPVLNWINKIPFNGLAGMKVATFDTRTIMDDKVPGFLKFLARIFGYAAQPLAIRLVKKGGTLATDPEGFLVEGSEGPLAEGELKRAEDWGKKVIDSTGTD